MRHTNFAKLAKDRACQMAGGVVIGRKTSAAVEAETIRLDYIDQTEVSRLIYVDLLLAR